MLYNIIMKILAAPITKADLLKSEIVFDGPMVKAVVDTDQRFLAIDANMHADLEQLLLENGSSQSNLWGINLYPADPDTDFIEFDSMINIRPRQGNRSRDVADPAIRAQITEVVHQWIQ